MDSNLFIVILFEESGNLKEYIYLFFSQVVNLRTSNFLDVLFL